MKITELAQKLEISVDTVRLWRKNGLPVGHDKSGRIEINERQAADWLARTGKIKHARKLIVIKATDNKRRKRRIADISQTDDLESMLARCRQVELDAWNIYQDAPPPQKLYTMEQHRQQNGIIQVS